MISFRQLSNNVSATNWKWIWIGLAAVPATRLYYVQEMIAALIIFSVLFVGVAIVALIIFLVDRVSQQIVVWASRVSLEWYIGSLMRSRHDWKVGLPPRV